MTAARPCRRRREQSAQAIVETAIVLPIMLFLVAGFIALMLQLNAQQRLDSAVALAAEATFQAPRADAGADGLPTRCRFAWQTFEGSVGDDNFDHPDHSDPAHKSPAYLTYAQRPLCRAAGAHSQWPQQADIQCDIDADNRHRTVCDAAATLHYDRTPLAWAIFWTPTISAHAEAVAPPFRQ
jgi:hypothetical protein